jgi:hypothetical protein
MHITIENNKVIVHLDEGEVPAFSAMFDTLHDKIGVSVEFRDFGFGDMTALRMLLPIHLCRTIGEGRHGRQAPRGAATAPTKRFLQVK